LATSASATGTARPICIGTQQGFCQASGKGHFTHAIGTGKQQGMGQTPPVLCRQQALPVLLMPGQIHPAVSRRFHMLNPAVG
jgi:hypothetical protein